MTYILKTKTLFWTSIFYVFYIHGATSLFASPPSNLSEQLQQSASTKVGEIIPFFAGWTVGKGSSQPTNRTVFLKQGADRYVVTLCANWCEPCKKGLTKLKAHEADFKKTNTALLAFVSGSNEEAKELYASHGIPWATFVVDRFGNYIPKLSRVENKSKENIQLPRTFVLDSKGKILKIIGQEGQDFIDLLIGRKP